MDRIHERVGLLDYSLLKKDSRAEALTLVACVQKGPARIPAETEFPEAYRSFLQAIQANFEIVPQITPPLFLSTSFRINR